jgi:hypothetical protein
MSLIAKSNGGASMSPIEAGTHPAVCYGLIDIGEQLNAKYNKLARKCIVMFEIPGETSTDADGREMPRTINITYTMSLHEKSALYRDLISWRGRPFTDEELAGFNLVNIVGAPCLLSIVHNERNGNTYADINGIMKLPKGFLATPPAREKIIFDLDEAPLETIDSLPVWVQNRIRESETYKERTAGAGYTGDTAQYVQGEFSEVSDEDELPF